MSVSFVFEQYDQRRLLMLHGAEAPHSQEWDEYLEVLRPLDIARTGLLVFTDGGAPNAGQRRDLNDLLAGRFFARAVVHDNALVRGVVSAVGWFAPGVRAFPPHDWRAGALYANFTEGELTSVALRVRRMHEHLTRKISWLNDALLL